MVVQDRPPARHRPSLRHNVLHECRFCGELLAGRVRRIPELAREFGPTPWTIALWVKQGNRDAGRGDGELTTTERAELTRLRRENRRLKMEREILAKAAACRYAWCTGSSSSARPSNPLGASNLPRVCAPRARRRLSRNSACTRRPP